MLMVFGFDESSGSYDEALAPHLRRPNLKRKTLAKLLYSFFPLNRCEALTPHFSIPTKFSLAALFKKIRGLSQAANPARDLHKNFYIFRQCG